jgi:hypothetical protein
MVEFGSLEAGVPVEVGGGVGAAVGAAVAAGAATTREAVPVAHDVTLPASDKLV